MIACLFCKNKKENEKASNTLLYKIILKTRCLVGGYSCACNFCLQALAVVLVAVRHS